jgi:hypothetical protein
MKASWQTWLKRLVIAGVVGFVLIQLIPVDRSNPPVTREIQWNSAETQQLAQNACYDCHSNQSEWPWYSYVAPASWLVAHDVEEGREHLNFTEWDRPNEEAEEILEEVEEGSMPLTKYVLLHPEANLSAAERQTLLAGLEQTLANDPPIGEDDDSDHDEDEREDERE